MRRLAFRIEGPGDPLTLTEDQLTPGPGEVVLDIAGCALSPEELGGAAGVPGRAVSGWVAEEGPGVSGWLNRPVLAASHADGGLASHVILRADALVSVPEALEERLPELAALVHPVARVHAAIEASGIGLNEVALFTAADELTGFGVQLAAARGAVTLATGEDTPLLMRLFSHGARGVLAGDAYDADPALQAEALRGLALAAGAAPGPWRAFGAWGGPVAEVLSLTATPLDAEPRPGALDTLIGLVGQGLLDLAPFVAPVPTTRINQLRAAIRQRELKQQPVLVPDFPTSSEDPTSSESPTSSEDPTSSESPT